MAVHAFRESYRAGVHDRFQLKRDLWGQGLVYMSDCVERYASDRPPQGQNIRRTEPIGEEYAIGCTLGACHDNTFHGDQQRTYVPCTQYRIDGQRDTDGRTRQCEITSMSQF